MVATPNAEGSGDKVIALNRLHPSALKHGSPCS
jgi:hypothetical protein